MPAGVRPAGWSGNGLDAFLTRTDAILTRSSRHVRSGGIRLSSWPAATSGSTSAPRPASARPTPCSTRDGAAWAAAPRWSWRWWRPTGAPSTEEQLEGLEVVPRRTVAYRGTTLQEMDLDARPRAGAGRRAGRRARPHQRARQPQREALAGHRGAARGRDRRDLHGQHPAPRGPQRRGRGHHRHPPGRDGPGRLGARGRPDRARGHDPRGGPAAHGARQHLPGRAHRRRPRQLLPGRQPVRAPGARAALGGRPGGRGARRVPRPATGSSRRGRHGSGSSSR